MASKLDISEPSLPRQRKVPRRFESGSAQAEFPDSPISHYRKIYYEALDLIINCIRKRFDQPGYKVYRQVQDLLLKAARNDDYTSEFDFATNFYGSDFHSPALKVQLQVFSEKFNDKIQPTLGDIFTIMKNLSSAEKELLSEVSVLTKLVLVMPATNAISERSFSALRRVKTYLRSTMNQDRLNHLMVLHIHKNMTDNLILTSVANQFVANSEHRLAIFRKFHESDLIP